MLPVYPNAAGGARWGWHQGKCAALLPPMADDASRSAVRGGLLSAPRLTLRAAAAGDASVPPRGVPFTAVGAGRSRPLRDDFTPGGHYNERGDALLARMMAEGLAEHQLPNHGASGSATAAETVRK